jgi:ribonuclease HI
VAIIKIVCDASYNEKLWFSGYAGLINIERNEKGEPNRAGNSETLMYQGVAAEQRTSQEGEILAILVGLRELAQRGAGQKKHELAGSTINIHSDCQGAILRIRDFDAANMTHSLEDFYLNEIHSKVNEFDWRLKTHHVPAHVPNHQATGIQRLNNLVDERARKTLEQALELMLNPHKYKKPGQPERVAVLLPTKPLNENEGDAWATLGRHLAESGKKMHLYIEGNPATHPFLDAVESFAHEKKINLAKIARVFAYMPDFLKKPLNKLDLTLTRHHMMQRNLNTNVEFTDSEIHIRAALASRIIYGNPSPSVMPSNFSGRTTPAVDAIYDLMDTLKGPDYTLPNSVQGWMHTFQKYVNIPLHKGLAKAFELEGLENKRITFYDEPEREHLAPLSNGDSGNTDYIPHREDEMFEAFHEIYINSKDVVKPNQLAQLFIDEFREHGNEFPEMAVSSIERFVYATGKKDTNDFINRVIKQIQKLSPRPADLAFPNAVTSTPKQSIDVAPEVAAPGRR